MNTSRKDLVCGPWPPEPAAERGVGNGALESGLNGCGDSAGT